MAGKNIDDYFVGAKTVDDVLLNKTLTNTTSTGMKHYEITTGTFDDALNEFYALTPLNVKTFEVKGKGTLYRGYVGEKIVKVRNFSRDKRPTLEINKVDMLGEEVKEIEIRYGKKQ